MKGILLAVFLFFGTIIYGQTPSKTYWIADDAIYSLETDGSNLYIGGDFTYVGPNTGHMAQITKTSTEPNLSFPTINGTVYCIVSDNSGGWYVGGHFDKVADSVRNNLVHITSSNLVDSWNPNVNETVSAMVLDGSYLYIGGYFSSVNGHAISNTAKIDVSTGSPDLTWAPNPNNSVDAILISGSDIYLGGDFTTLNGNSIPHLGKVNKTDGTADNTWKPSPDGKVLTLCTDDANIFLGGSFQNVDSQTRNYLAKVALSDGSLDTTWDPDANNSVNTLVYSNPYVYAGGIFTSIGGGAHYRVGKINANTGAVSSSWTPIINNDVGAILIDGSDIYIGGQFNSVNNTSWYGLVRVNDSDGTIDATWNPNVHDLNGNAGYVYSIAINSDDVFFGGRFISANGESHSRIAKIKSTGEVDNSWNPSVDNSRVYDIALDGSDVYIAGSFTSVNSTTRNRAAKLSAADGSLDATWNPNSDYDIRSLAVTSTNVYCGGVFWNIGGQARNSIAKLNKTNGNADASWNPGASSGSTVYSVAVDGSYIYAGGSFTTIGGLSRNYIAKLDDSNGNAVSGWDANASSSVYKIKIIGSDIYTGGAFTTIGGLSRNYAAKLNSSTGAADNSWNPNLNNSVEAISEVGSNILIGGHFTNVGGSARDYVAIVNNSDGAVYSPFAPVVEYFINDLDGSTGDVYLGGSFTKINNNSQPCLAFFFERDLPVELTSLTASAEKNRVNLYWQTATEVNNYGFQIERQKAKGESKWENIGFVEGHGNSNSAKNYSFIDTDIKLTGKIKYRLKQIDIDGHFKYSDIVEVNISTTEKFELIQNYPNPFNPTTTINYSIPAVETRHALSLQLIVYDALGRKVATLVNKKQSPGNYSVKFDASKLSTGIYFYTLRAGNFSATKKMILMK